MPDNAHYPIDTDRPHHHIDYDGGRIAVFDDGDIGVSFADPSNDVIPREIVPRIVAIWAAYAEAGFIHD